jgi:flagellar biosynthesis/type III secretory pathway protein FliH
MSSTTATQLLGKPEATAEYQSMLDETFTAFDFRDPESDRIRENATTPDKLIELDKKYYQKQKDFAEEQKEYRQQKGNSPASKAASLFKAQTEDAGADNQEEGSNTYASLSNEELNAKIDKAKETVNRLSAELDSRVESRGMEP